MWLQNKLEDILRLYGQNCEKSAEKCLIFIPTFEFFGHFSLFVHHVSKSTKKVNIGSMALLYMAKSLHLGGIFLLEGWQARLKIEQFLVFFPQL